MDGFADRRGDFVVVDGGDVGGVEDGLDGDVGVAVGEPAAELFEGDGSVGGAEHAVVVDQGVVADMHVDDGAGPVRVQFRRGHGSQVEG